MASANPISYLGCMDASELLVFAICLLTLSFLAGVMDATKGVGLKKRLLCWGAWALLAAVPVFFLMQVLPDGATTVAIYSSSDRENSLVGPISAAVFLAFVVAVGWLGRQLGKVVKVRITGNDMT